MKEMTPRERVQCALDHRQPDRQPIDFGGTVVTCMDAGAHPETSGLSGHFRGFRTDHRLLYGDRRALWNPFGRWLVAMSDGWG